MSMIDQFRSKETGKHWLSNKALDEREKLCIPRARTKVKTINVNNKSNPWVRSAKELLS